MSQPKIAVVVHTHPSVTRGGAEISGLNLHNGLKRLGYDSTLITMCPGNQKAKATLGPDEHLIEYEPRNYDPFYHIAPPATFDAIKAVLDQVGAEVVMFHHFLFVGANTVKRIADSGRVVALTLHEYLAMCHNHGQMVTTDAGRLCRAASPTACADCFPGLEASRFAVRRQFLLESFSGVSAFVSPSRFLADRVVQWGLPSDRLHVIENGLTASGDDQTATALDGTISEASTDEEEKPFVVGFFGQVNPFKGVDVIIAAAEILAANPTGPIQFRIHGTLVSLNDSLRERFDNAVALGVIDYRGPYENSEVAGLMGACDYVLMASRWWENSPVVIQEAFAARRPLIVPGIGGMAEKVADRLAGFHFRTGDSADLAQVIRRAMIYDRSKFVLPTPLTAEEMAQRYIDAVIPAPTAKPASGSSRSKPAEPALQST